MGAKLLLRLSPLNMFEEFAFPPFSLDKTVDTIPDVPLVTQPSAAPLSPPSSEVEIVPTLSLRLGEAGLVVTIEANAIIASLCGFVKAFPSIIYHLDNVTI
jgi:hypothetical protein